MDNSHRGLLAFYASFILSTSPLGETIDYRALILPEPARVSTVIDLNLPDYLAPLIARSEVLSDRLQSAYGINAQSARKFSWWIVDSANYHGLPENTLAALIMTESTFRTDVKSRVGALGPAQIRPEVWSQFCLHDIQIPEHNIFCAGRILAHYLKRYDGDWSKTVSAYNVGPSRVYKRRYAKARQRYISKMEGYEEALVNVEQINE